MDARFYNSDEIDIEQLANNLENIYRAQNYQVQQVGSRDQVMVQLKKGSDFEALIGMQAALSVILQRSGGGVIAMIGQQRWIDKAAVGAVGIIAAPVLWPLMLTAGAGAIRQASLGNQVLNVVDGLVRQQRPEIQVGPVPVQIMPQLQQQYIPPPQYTPPAYIPPPQYTPPAYTPPPPVVNALPSSAPVAKQLRCPSCNTPYQPGDTYCSGCGKSLVTICPNCKSEVQDNASFCPKCGASIFQPLAATQAAPPVQPQTPVYTPPPTPAYTPPAQQTPVYTPYTQPPEPEPYVPPVPKEPPVMPKTTITYSPSAPRQEAPPAQKQLPQQEVYYTPPPDLSPAPPKPQAPPVRPQPIAPRPIAAKPAAQPAYNPAATWGYLAFSDGKQIALSGERAVVGRYDHDIGGIQPEADLSSVPGSDTVSRIHAALEHIGSTFTVTDLNSTNSTRLNGKRLEPDKATPINDGDSLSFGKATCTFKKA
ncbi:MAG: zinc-ribbon domain-containing protein [Chloroflexi bacterium]|nr:MAG: zinc-ribbon domain-containing protein [Chloroflexota bacterium]